MYQLIQLYLYQWVILALSILASIIVGVYALNTFLMTVLFLRNGKNNHKPPRVSEWPRVSIHLPIFNEKNVVRRLLEACVNLDYPRDRFQIIVIDDSTDETTGIVEEYETRYPDVIKVIHRETRKGFKAGALQEALKYSRGDFVAVFDADYVPPRDFLRNLIPYFHVGERVGFVQARIGFVDGNVSWLTRSISLALEGYYVVEQGARYTSGLFASSFGTAGIFRREAIEDAGGWQSDTLSEDLDISYRIQMRGWRGVFVPDVVCPGEVPPVFGAFKKQQYRWVKGVTQCLKKHSRDLMRNHHMSFFQRFEAFMHLSYTLVYPVSLFGLFFNVLALFFLPIDFQTSFWSSSLAQFLIGFSAMVVASPLFLYIVATLKGRGFRYLRYLPALGLLWYSLTLTNARATLEALFGRASPFGRTPKFGVTDENRNFEQREYKVTISEKHVEVIVTTIIFVVSFVAFRLGLFWSACGVMFFGIGWLASVLLSLKSEKMM